jgi:hypothetical protein
MSTELSWLPEMANGTEYLHSNVQQICISELQLELETFMMWGTILLNET